MQEGFEDVVEDEGDGAFAALGGDFAVEDAGGVAAPFVVGCDVFFGGASICVSCQSQRSVSVGLIEKFAWSTYSVRVSASCSVSRERLCTLLLRRQA